MIEKLGPYRIEKQIGRGGMGTVYAGVHEETGQRAAIKSLSQALADDSNFRERFITEIETLKQLRHPNIVQLYGDGEQDGQLFYVMELVEGCSLQDELQAGHRFEWQEVIQITVQICQALKHAHDHGVIHRDLKPANLLRTPDRQIKLTDFGIAKLFGGTHLTADGSVVGTADYMAPEQAEGGAVTNRTDLYSLGNVMFTLLARRPPFAGCSLPQVVHKLRYEEPPSVRQFAPTVPPELDQIIAQLLRKDPKDRVATALALSNRLRAMDHALAGGTAVDRSTPVSAAPSPVAPPPQPPAAPVEDKPTRPGGRDKSPATEVAPTLDSSLEDRNRDYSWNDATMITSQDPPHDPELASRETVADSDGEKRNRFTTLEEERRHRFGEDQESRPSGPERLKTAALALALLGVIAATVWGLMPRSANSLYRQIQASHAAGKLDENKDEIDEFLERFPDDPRAGEVHDWWLDVEAEWHFSRIVNKNKRETLAEVEADYMTALQSRTVDTAETSRQLAALIERFDDADDAALLPDGDPAVRQAALRELVDAYDRGDDAIQGRLRSLVYTEFSRHLQRRLQPAD